MRRKELIMLKQMEESIQLINLRLTVFISKVEDCVSRANEPLLDWRTVQN